MVGDARAVHLPKVNRLAIRHMSLYREKPLIDVDFGDGVFCLAGANGLGKSTFLAVLNFAMTGIVADPDQKFASLKEYYRHSLTFSKDYFTGRVEELDRDLAEVTIWFSVGESAYKLSRSMFQSQGLRRLEISNIAGAAVYAADSEDNTEAHKLHERYVASIGRDTGLANFEQFVFLQHFLLTFDERRHLLFWDADVTRQALFLAFGIDGNTASQADEWLRRADRLESQARNAQYQATTARQRAKELADRAQVDSVPDEGLVDTYREIVAEFDRASEALKTRIRAAEDGRYKYTIAAADLHALTTDYDRLFNDELTSTSEPRLHPLVQNLIGQHECGICGAHGDLVHNHAEEALSSRRCPLCMSPVTQRKKHAPDGFEKLEELDRKIAERQLVVHAAEEASVRLAAEVEEARAKYESCMNLRSEFEKSHVDISVTSDARESATVLAMIHQLEAERSGALQRRDDFRKKRDEFRNRLGPIQDELAVRYVEAEQEFMPRFQKLAREFLGLDLQITLELRARGPELALMIEGTPRRLTTQLSESQRYFVDIALRMALAEHLCGNDEPACLLVDTPEGSLDIAYESRAGRMFGRFVRANNRLIMTANINSSRLVQELALACGQQYMRVERMTDWTTLSEVQAEAEELFAEAFSDIEQALVAGSAEQ